VKLAQTYPRRLVCRLLGVPRSSVYYATRPVPDEEAMLKTALLDLAGEWPTYGYRRLTAHMRRLGWPVNGKRVRRWMDELNLTGAPPTRKKRTTNSVHPFPRYENLVKTLEIQRPEQVWVADITYIRLRTEFVYLAVLMDVFTRSIRGWHLSRNIDQGLTLAALERALLLAVPAIHHSDQGLQYAATDYVDRLQRLGVTLSMAAVGEPRENGYAERLMRTVVRPKNWTTKGRFLWHTGGWPAAAGLKVDLAHWCQSRTPEGAASCRPGSVLAPESALGSVPTGALSSAQVGAVVGGGGPVRHWSSNSFGVR
jgi:transposase InsO family protein